jgi:putative phosphoesterase
MKIKIGVLSDTHLHRVTRKFTKIYDNYLADKDLLLHAGDYVSTDMVDFLSRKDFHGVYGNMDPFEVKELLPAKKIIELGPYRLGITHGWGPSAGLEGRIRPEFTDVDIIVYGHSHHAVNHIKDGVLIFNPGTATGFSSNGIHTIGILELGDTIHGEIIRV